MATYSNQKAITSVSGLSGATNGALEHLRTHGQQAVTIYNGHQQRVAAAMNHPDLNVDAKRRLIDNSRQQALGETADLKQRTGEALQTLQDAHRAARRPAADPAAETLAYQKQRDAWTRAERQLQRGTSPAEIIQAAAKAGDTDTLAALHAELPSYLSPAQANAAMQQLGQAEAPYLTPVETAVRAQEAELPDLQSAASYNQNGLEYALNDLSGQTKMHQFIGPKKTVIPTQQATAAGRGGLPFSHQG